jgi:hydroxypyruvate isomerase
MNFALCIELVFRSLPFEDRIQAAADAGFKNINMWYVKDVNYAGTPAHLAALARKAGVTIISSLIGAPDSSIGGGLIDPANRQQWLERAKMTIEFNKAAGIGAAVICPGNIVPGMSDAQMEASVIEGLKATLALAEANDMTLLLEPLNTTYDHPGQWLDSSDRAAEICRRFNSSRMRLFYDCYHMQIMEGDLMKHIERNLDVIGLFNAAGVPGRNELFKGEINYPFVIKRLEALGYDGVFVLAYRPSMDDAESLRQTLEYLR